MARKPAPVRPHVRRPRWKCSQPGCPLDGWQEVPAGPGTALERAVAALDGDHGPGCPAADGDREVDDAPQLAA
jgi:hypothetical protein